jgi:acyl carrier protein
MPVRVDVAGMRAQAARGGEIPAILRGLAGPVRLLSAASAAGASSAGADSLRSRLAASSRADQSRILTDLVRTHVAAVLGHASADAVELGRAFTDLGFDSLTAVDLRNRLSAATGVRLPATLVFDYPTAAVLATHLGTELLGAPNVSAAQPTSIVTMIEPGEPIAIVGMGCRFPGDVHDPEALWTLLAAGGDAVTPLPLDRGWDIAGLYDPDPDKPGSFYAKSGGFVHDAGDFDPGFFGISPREALAMDPQQRLLLEISWEALERAGIDPNSVRGSQTGVYAGGTTWGYGLFSSNESEGHLMTGAATSVLAGRVSYTLGLEGPGRHDRHGLLVLARRHAPRRAGPARGGVLARAGRRRDDHGDAVRACRLLPAARPRSGRPLQGVLGLGGRHGHVRRRRNDPARKTL